MYNVLLVEDSKEIFQLVQQSLSSIAEVTWAENFLDGKELIEKKKFSLAIFDIELPDGNGLELCSIALNKNTEQPIFILTAHDNLSEKVLGFSAGADDYITKPFDLLEFKARVESKLRKMDLLKKSSDVLKWNKIEINKSSQEVKVQNDNETWEPVDLTALEFKLLCFFAAQPGAVVQRDVILDTIWGKDIHVYARSVDTHVSKLRKKLGPSSQLIESVHGAGYKFNPTR